MDFVAYHSQDVMGNELGDGPPFAMLSRKPVSHLDGQVVWVIEGRGRKKQYFLKQRFTVDLIEKIDDDYFRFQFTGQDGISFTPEIPLSVHTWFKDFLKAVANFSIGVSPLKPEFQRRFLELDGPFDTSTEDVADKSDWQLTEGEIQTTLRTYKTRNSEARTQCIEYYGSTCLVCKMEFGTAYGDECEGFIEIHHRNLLSEVDGPYSVNPITDLVPLCPNCHRAAHLLSVDIDELTKIYHARHKVV